MGRAKRQGASNPSSCQSSLKHDIKQVATATDTVADEQLSWAVVGAELEVRADYLDMKDAPEQGGLAHSGYLVLRRGEVVRIYYVGSEKTGDADWLYGEVQQARSRP